MRVMPKVSSDVTVAPVHTLRCLSCLTEEQCPNVLVYLALSLRSPRFVHHLTSKSLHDHYMGVCWQTFNSKLLAPCVTDMAATTESRR